MSPATKARAANPKRTGRAPPRTPRAARAPRGPAVAPPEPERDYLVIFDEPDDSGLPSDDSLVLDVDTGPASPRGELDVQQKLDLDLRNDRTRWGTLGFVVCLIGAALGIGLLAAFAVNYPGDYYRENLSINPEPIPTMLALAVVSLVLLIVGTIITHYGRRIQARANLTSVRIVEKASSSHATFRD